MGLRRGGLGDLAQWFPKLNAWLFTVHGIEREEVRVAVAVVCESVPGVGSCTRARCHPPRRAEKRKRRRLIPKSKEVKTGAARTAAAIRRLNNQPKEALAFLDLPELEEANRPGASLRSEQVDLTSWARSAKIESAGISL